MKSCKEVFQKYFSQLIQNFHLAVTFTSSDFLIEWKEMEKVRFEQKISGTKRLLRRPPEQTRLPKTDNSYIMIVPRGWRK